MNVGSLVNELVICLFKNLAGSEGFLSSSCITSRIVMTPVAVAKRGCGSVPCRGRSYYITSGMAPEMVSEKLC